MRKTGAEIVIGLLERQGIDTIAGIPGGANLPLYDALRSSGIRHVLARHEQGAAFIAQGMARATGRAAVCFGTSGPGATNLLTAIADAKLDSIPLISITGQVPTALIGTDAFQEVDTYGLTLPITKHNFLVRDARHLFDVMHDAFRIAESGRPGPVVIDLPKDIQTQAVEFESWPEPWAGWTPPRCDAADLEEIAALVRTSERPVLVAGGGVIAAGAHDALREFSRRNRIPVAVTLAGLGSFHPGDPLYLGMLGMHGAASTNLIMDEADLLIAIGLRFDDRATGKATEFCRHASIVHIDIDPSEINKIKPANLAFVGDANEALRTLIPMVPEDSRSVWTERVADLKSSNGLQFPDDSDPLQPLNFVRHLGRLLGPDAIVTTDVGQHQMWVAQAYPFRRPRSLLTSGGLGTMGFGLPAAIGAALACPDKPVVCVSGDGSFLMNIQELATLAELGLNVKVFILNNRQLGLVRQQQELFYGERYHASRFEATPDFVAIARGFGVSAYSLDGDFDAVRTLEAILQEPGPCIVDVPIHERENVLPMVPPGAANRDMIVQQRILA